MILKSPGYLSGTSLKQKRSFFFVFWILLLINLDKKIVADRHFLNLPARFPSFLSDGASLGFSSQKVLRVSKSLTMAGLSLKYMVVHSFPGSLYCKLFIINYYYGIINWFRFKVLSFYLFNLRCTLNHTCLHSDF